MRSNKPVFFHDVGTSELSPDSDKPKDLAVFADYHRADQERVRQICEFLYKERNFDVWLDIKDIRPGTLWEKEIQKGIADRLNRGGYLVVFWSNEAESRSKSIQEALATAASGIEGVNDRVLFALLEPCDLPKFWEQFQEPSVQLYGDSERSATHRIDDLVVRLYWLIYRKTKISHETPAADELNRHTFVARDSDKDFHRSSFNPISNSLRARSVS